MYAHVAEYRTHGEYSDRERLAIEFAERFALDHLAMDERFFEQLRGAFTDAEILDLGVCVANFLGLGRLLRVLDLEASCDIAPGGS